MNKLKLLILGLLLVANQAIAPVYQADISEYNCMLVALWHEARGEPEEGIKAVAQVILNRRDSGKYPSSICGVILQPKQFSNVQESFKALGFSGSGEAVEQAVSLPNKQGNARVARISFDAVYAVLTHSRAIPKSILMYHHKDSKVYWSKSLVNRRVIGSHLFGMLQSTYRKV